MTKEEILGEFKWFKDISMGGLPFTREDFLKDRFVSRREIEKHFGNYSNLKAAAQEHPRIEPETALESPATQSIISVEGENVRSLEELAEYSKIDLSQWEATKFAVSLWDKKTSVKAEFKRRIEKENIEGLLSTFIKEAAKHSPKEFTKPKSKIYDGLAAINLSDIHLNKFGRKNETGYEDCDLEKSISIFNQTLDALVEKTLRYSKVGKFLLVLGNDYLNADGINGATTAQTPQDNDKSWFEAFVAGAKLMTDAIERLAAIAPVDVVVCMGNHDTQSSFAIGEYVKAWFRNNPYVNIDNEPKFRKYYRYSHNAFLISHGNNEKLSQLPLIMATECPFWGECENREIFSHHVHHQSVFEDCGVITRVFPALSGCDNYHAKKGYVGSRQVGQILFYGNHGLDAVFEYQPR